MNILGLCLVIQLCLAFGVGGLFWPDKLMPLFSVLMFPWTASYRAIRAKQHCRYWIVTTASRKTAHRHPLIPTQCLRPELVLSTSVLVAYPMPQNCTTSYSVVGIPMNDSRPGNSPETYDLTTVNYGRPG